MRCASCGHDNRPAATFCGACAASLTGEIACPACGVANPADQRFCDTCGGTLGARERPASAEDSVPAAVGGGRYQIRRILGEGAKKVVYLAHDTRRDREVAIALIKTEGLDEAGLARVTREARAMGRLGDHPHVVTVHDAGEESGRPYLVSEYMAGG